MADAEDSKGKEKKTPACDLQKGDILEVTGLQAKPELKGLVHLFKIEDLKRRWLTKELFRREGRPESKACKFMQARETRSK